ncbi:hypothetical protein [Georgenia wangjunii]|uniref:hypothetical protein n=1 Tax=Georgenia wangjunii TaxID=3117730 RepID=UPI002F26C9CE
MSEASVGGPRVSEAPCRGPRVGVAAEAGVRPASRRERAVLHRMLDALGDEAAALRAQVDGAQVSGGCGCGCPTVYLEHPPTPRCASSDVATAAIAGSSDFLILFVSDGWLDQLEYVPVGDETPGELPAAELLDVSAVLGR